MKLIRLGLKEISAAPRFVLFFILNITLGLSGLILLENFKQTFQTNLSSRSKTLLGADLSVGGRRPLKVDRKNKITDLIHSEEHLDLIDLFSMARSKKQSRLIYLSEFHPTFPFYGGYKLRSGESSPNIKLADDHIFVYPELLIQLHIKIGDQLKIGSKNFTIADVVEEDSSQTFQMGSIAPKIFITRKGIHNAGLIKKGSTAFYTTYFKSNTKLNDNLIEDIVNIVNDNALKVTTPKNSSEQVGRVVNYLTDFLGLVSLVALSLALIGIFYLFRSYLAERQLNFAIMTALGISKNSIILSQTYTLVALALLGTLGALLLSAATLPIIEYFLKFVIPFDLNLKNYPESTIIGMLVGTLGAIFTGLPMIINSVRQPTPHLFQEGTETLSPISSAKIISYLPLLLFFITLSVWVSNSIKIGLIFFLVVSSIIAVVFLALNWLLRYAETRISFKRLERSLSFRYLTRYRVSTISIFLSLFLGSLFITFIPSLKEILDKELDGGLNGPTPSLFLFDIQEEQLPSVIEFTKSKNLKLLGLSPMIRTRLIKVNGSELKVDAKIASTREGQREQRFRNRGVNITYKSEFNSDEAITKGSPISAFSGTGYPQISLEFRYANRLDLKIGDLLTFDIMGIEQIAQISSLRRVRWTSFRPNFFIIFPPGVLEDAPKTYLAAVPTIAFHEKIQFQTDLVEKFPNVSAVDLDRLVTKIKEILQQMSVALAAMSLVIILVGLIVIFSLVHHQVERRRRDISLLKILGMSLPRLKLLILSEFFYITASASILGSFVGCLASYGFSIIFFEGMWILNPLIPILTVFSITSLGVAISYFAISRSLKQKVASFL